MPTTEAPPKAPIPGHVPVEHRFLGLDRRTIPLTLVVFGIMALFMWVIPAVNDAVGWDDETKAGDVLDLGAGVTLAPPVGWNLANGIRIDDEPVSGVTSPQNGATFGNGGVSVSVLRSGFDGTADQLLDQANRLRTKSDAEPNRAFKVTGPRKTVTTASGLTGVSESYTSANGEGRMLAFTLDAGKAGTSPTGITITIDGSSDAYAAQARELDAMLDSLTFEGTAS